MGRVAASGRMGEWAKGARSWWGEAPARGIYFGGAYGVLRSSKCCQANSPAEPLVYGDIGQ